MMDITVRISDADYKTYCKKLNELQLVYNGSEGLNFIESDVVEVTDSSLADDQGPNREVIIEPDRRKRSRRKR